ncbi:MAG: murein biosynthesis integral membrane protein MurJ [Burkholderiales bacterium]|nr:murein biosynthesis integral membrane protein MurJ [Pseudomonadota bacterium]
MNLLRATASVSSMTLISRIVGYIRDVVIARSFGAGFYTDAFFVAFRIPNLLRRLFAEGAFTQAFTPILAEYRNRLGFAATHALVDRVATLLALILFVVTALGVAGAPFIVYASAYGFVAEPDKFDLTVQLLRIVFPYIFFISLVSLAAGILNMYSQFKVPAFTPVLLNVSFISFALFGAPYFDPPIKALAWGVFFGGILQLVFQIPFLRKLGLLPRFKFDMKDAGVWRVLKLMAPAVFGVSIAQISLLINTLLASFLPHGSVSWLYYAERLMEFPSALLGVALGTVLLPSLARHYADRDSTQYSELLDWGLRLAMVLTLPAALALALLSAPLIATLYHYGAFSIEDVAMTRQALLAYSLGLTGMIMVKILAPGFYARQNIKTPVKIALVTLVVTQMFNLIFIWRLQHAGLALAIGLGACTNAGLLYHKLRKHNIYRPQPGWRMYAMKVAIALIAMCVVLWFSAGSDQSWLGGTAVERGLRLSGVIALGAATYLGTLGLLGFRPRDFLRRAAE